MNYQPVKVLGDEGGLIHLVQEDCQCLCGSGDGVIIVPIVHTAELAMEIIMDILCDEHTVPLCETCAIILKESQVLRDDDAMWQAFSEHEERHGQG